MIHDTHVYTIKWKHEQVSITMATVKPVGDDFRSFATNNCAIKVFIFAFLPYWKCNIHAR
jgi:hypothetical protein